MTKKEKLYLVLILVLALVTLVMLRFGGGRGERAPSASAGTSSEPKVVVKEVEKLVEVEKKVSAEIIEDGLRDMGLLVTGEYWFTDVLSASTIKKFLTIPLPFTESGYVVRYDGVVQAGVDLGAARIEKDDGARRVRVWLPAAQITAVDIDYDSFQLLEEKTGAFNRLSVEDYNDSLRELKAKVQSDAVDRGLLDKANENAVTMVSNFVRSLAGSGYTADVQIERGE